MQNVDLNRFESDRFSHGCAAKRAEPEAARVLRWLLGLVLILQLVGSAGGFAPHRQAPRDGTSVTADLSAALGRDVPICHHGNPDSPDTPDTPASCDHCTCCPPALGAAVLALAGGIEPRPSPSVRTVIYDGRAAAVTRPVLAGHASPRGPPKLS